MKPTPNNAPDASFCQPNALTAVSSHSCFHILLYVAVVVKPLFSSFFLIHLGKGSVGSARGCRLSGFGGCLLGGALVLLLLQAALFSGDHVCCGGVSLAHDHSGFIQGL